MFVTNKSTSHQCASRYCKGLPGKIIQLFKHPKPSEQSDWIPICFHLLRIGSNENLVAMENILTVDTTGIDAQKQTTTISVYLLNVALPLLSFVWKAMSVSVARTTISPFLAGSGWDHPKWEILINVFPRLKCKTNRMESSTNPA